MPESSTSTLLGLPGKGSPRTLEEALPAGDNRGLSPKNLLRAEKQRFLGNMRRKRFEIALGHGTGKCQFGGTHLETSS